MKPTRTDPAWAAALGIALATSALFLGGCDAVHDLTGSDAGLPRPSALLDGGDSPVQFVVSSGSCSTLSDLALWLVRPSDGTRQRLTTYNCFGAARGNSNITPEWSPDGQRIAWAEFDVSDNFDIRIMNADGSAAATVVNGFLTESPSFSWSPDGRQIVFADLACPECNFEIFRTDAITCDAPGCPATPPVRLTTNLASDQMPAWSPDGRAIAFVSSRDGGGIYSLCPEDPSFVWRITSDASDNDPSWSPDGERIAFSRRLPGNPSTREIFVVGRYGDGLQQLTTDAGDDAQPVWSPDGSRIFFLSDRDGTRAIYAMNRDGSAQERVLALERSISYFDVIAAPPPPPSTANLTVTTATTGVDLDPNGYTVTIAGPSGTSRVFWMNETVTFTNLTPGNYTVTLSGVANNCVITSVNQQGVAVPSGGTGRANNTIACGTIMNGGVTGLGALGVGPRTPGTNRMDFDFDATSAPGGRMVLTDYFIINPDGGAARMTADPTMDPRTGITSLSRISPTCVRFGGIGGLRTGDTQRFIIDACDNANPGAGVDRLVIVLPDESQVLRQGAISEGDIGS